MRRPWAVTSAGGRFALKDNGETPDTQDALFEYPGWTATWSHRECSRGADPAMGLEFCGTRGSLKISRKGFVVTSDPKLLPDEMVPRFGRAPSGRRAGDGTAATRPRAEHGAIEDRSGDEFDQFKRHARNFLECVKSRGQPDLGPGGRPSCRHGLPSGKPVAAAGPEAALGRRPRNVLADPEAKACSNGPTGRRGTPNVIPSSGGDDPCE